MAKDEELLPGGPSLDELARNRDLNVLVAIAAILCVVLGVLGLLYRLISRRMQTPKSVSTENLEGASVMTQNSNESVQNHSSAHSVASDSNRGKRPPKALRRSSSGSTENGTSAPSSSGPRFPFLRVSNRLEGATPATLQPNSRQPIQMNSANCEGSAVIMLRTDPPDPAFAVFFDRKRRMFELQFCLRFKVPPSGVLYLGGQLPARMHLGHATEFLCRALLAFSRRLAPSLHASFGDQVKGGELPHIVFPLFYAADRLVITKAGETPPKPGEGPIPESDQARALRMKNPTLGRGAFTSDDWISFSFHSQYLDLVQWKVRNMGALRDQSLTLFWDAMPLEVIIYDMDPSAKKHIIPPQNYYLRFELENTWSSRLEGEGGVIFAPNDGTGAAEFDPSASSSSSSSSSHGPSAVIRAGSHAVRQNFTGAASKRRFTKVRELGRNLRRFFGGAGASSPAPRPLGSPPDSEDDTASGVAALHTLTLLDAKVSVPAWIERSKYETRSIVAISPDGNSGNPPVAGSTSGERRRRSRRARSEAAYLIHVRGSPARDGTATPPLSSTPPLPASPVSSVLTSHQSAISTLDQLVALPWEDALRLVAAATTAASLGSPSQTRPPAVLAAAGSAMANDFETRRRALDDGLKHLAIARGHPISIDLPRSSMLHLNPFYDLQHWTTTKERVRRHMDPETAQILYECPVLRALSESHWRAEWSVVMRAHSTSDNQGGDGVDYGNSGRVFVLFFQLGAKKPSRTLMARSVLSIKDALEKDACGVTSCFPSLFVETAEKVKAVCFQTLESMEAWKDAVGVPSKPTTIRPIIKRSAGSESSPTLQAMRPFKSAVSSKRDSTYFHLMEASASWGSVLKIDDARSTTRGSQPRVVLNTRKFIWGTAKVFDETRRTQLLDHAIALLKGFVSLTAKSAEAEGSGTQPLHSHAAAIELMNAASAFKSFDLLSWSESWTHEENMSFFLNVYHCILLHSKYIIGLPSSPGRWSNFMTQMSYEFGSSKGSFVLSLAEIEFCILRVGRSRQVSGFPWGVGRLPPLTPSTVALCLRRSDPRLVFALNYGTASCPERAPVFTSTGLDAQLSRCASSYLEEFFVVDANKGVVSVPFALYWNRVELIGGGAQLGGEGGSTQPTARVLAACVAPWLPPMLRNLLKLLLGGDEANFLRGLKPSGGLSSSSAPGGVRFRFRKFVWKPRADAFQRFAEFHVASTTAAAAAETLKPGVAESVPTGRKSSPLKKFTL